MTRITYTTFFMILAGLVLVAGGFLFVLEPQQQKQKSPESWFAYLQAGGRCLKLEVADTPEKRRQGLSGRKQLKSDEGMLFTYDKPGIYGFWMKDMNFPIDIIWLDESNRIVTVKERVQPSSYPQTFRPSSSAKKVIETTAGWADMQNINQGERLDLIAATTTNPSGCN